MVLYENVFFSGRHNSFYTMAGNYQLGTPHILQPFHHLLAEFITLSGQNGHPAAIHLDQCRMAFIRYVFLSSQQKFLLVRIG